METDVCLDLFRLEMVPSVLGVRHESPPRVKFRRKVNLCLSHLLTVRCFVYGRSSLRKKSLPGLEEEGRG